MTYRLNNKPNNSQKQYKWKERKKEKKGEKESKQASKIETSLIGNYEMQFKAITTYHVLHFKLLKNSSHIHNVLVSYCL